MKEIYGELSSNSHVTMAMVGVEMMEQAWTTQLEKRNEGKSFLYLGNCKTFSCKECDWKNKRG